MFHKFNRVPCVVLAGVTVWAGVITSPVSAQTSPQVTATSPEVALEEVVVTAQRREENSQKVPIAVTAINAAALETSNVTSALDIGKLVPTAVLQANDGYVTSFLRGIGSTQTTSGNEAEIPIYIDGVYIARLMPVMLTLNNVDRIEVLEGPQGTLFGRNSTGGLVQIVTRTPTPGQDTDARLSVGYGNYQTADASGYVGLSLGPKVAADFALVYHNQNDGWGRNIVTGTEFNRGHSYAARTKWVFDPVEGTHIVLTGDYAYEDTDIGLTGLTLQDRPQPNGSALAPPGFGFYDSDSELGSGNYSRSRSRGVSLRFEQNVSFAKLVSISAYRSAANTLSLDVDGQPGILQELYEPNYDKQFTQELQLVSNDSSIPLTWTVGAFYLHHRFGYLPDSSLVGSAVLPVPGASLYTPAAGTTNSYSGYGQATYHTTPRLEVTAGVRYTEDKIGGSGGTIAVIPGAGPGGSSAVIPSLSSADASFSAVSWKGAVDYKVTDDAMVYGSVSRGFKAGLFNILTFSPVPIKPETVTAYEVGFKSELDDHRVRLNGALFWDDIKNFQTSLVESNGIIALTNANAARSRGIELNVNARATSSLTLRASAAYLDAKYTDFQDAPIYTPVANPPGGISDAVSGNADGHTLPRASKFTGNVGFDYTVPVPTGEFIIGAGYSFSSPFHWDADNLITQSSINLVDASITYALASTDFKVRLWGSNLTGAQYYSAEYEHPGPIGILGAAAAPRLFGVSFSYQLH